MTSHSSFPALSNARVALLFDGDHVPVAFRKTAEAKAKAMGTVIAGMVFCDVGQRHDWAGETGLQVHHCSSKSGKNAADMQLTITALDLAYRGLAQGFLVVSNDRDFDPLIRQLRLLGHQAERISTPQVAVKPRPDAMLEAVVELIRTAGEGGGLRVTALNPPLHALGYKIGETPEKTWRKWLTNRPQHFALDPRGPESKVRLVAVKP